MPVPTFKANVIRVELKGGHGDVGKSAYQSYVETTDDNPVLSEEAWAARSSGGNTITFWPNGVMSAANPSNSSDVRFWVGFETNPFP